MNTRDIVLIAVFAAVIAVLGIFPPVPVPLVPTPITAQSLGVMLAGGILGSKRGSLSVILFLLLVAVGLPLLSGGRGGLGVFVGATAGFIYGWVIAAFIIGLLVEAWWEKLNFVLAFAACVIGGVIVLYAFGIVGMTILAGTPIVAGFMGSAAYIPGDVVKAIIASILIITVAKNYPIIGRK